MFGFLILMVAMVNSNIYSQFPTSYTTERLKFEKPTKEHESYLSTILNNSQVQEIYNTGDLKDFTNIKAQMAIIEEQWNQYGYGLFILFNHKTSEFIGFAGYHTVAIDHTGTVDCFDKSKATNDLEIYLFLMPEHWRKGYGTEAISKLGELAFEYLPFTSIIAYAEKTNEASLALINKFKCKQDKEVIYNNKPHILFRMYKPIK